MTLSSVLTSTDEHEATKHETCCYVVFLFLIDQVTV
jgi:hypothetical protein